MQMTMKPRLLLADLALRRGSYVVCEFLQLQGFGMRLLLQSAVFELPIKVATFEFALACRSGLR